MKIIVCIKQVPASTDLKLDPVTNNLIRDLAPGVINPYDLYAIEEAVRLKERFGAEVTAISMGPPQAADTLREALALGIDQGVLITDRRFAGSDTLATAYVLAKSIRKLGDPDLIICGRQSVDGDTGQVGPELAGTLGFRLATNVAEIEDIDKDKIIVKRMTEDGYYRLKYLLPALITVTKEINHPRSPSLKGMMRAKKSEILNLSADQIGVDLDKIGADGSPTKVARIFKPASNPSALLITGDPNEAAKTLFDRLKEGKII